MAQIVPHLEVALRERFQVRVRRSRLIGERANVDCALAAVAAHARLPEDAPLVPFALARAAGPPLPAPAKGYP